MSECYFGFAHHRGCACGIGKFALWGNSHQSPGVVFTSMIKNEWQFKITKAQAEKFRTAIRSLESAPPDDTVHPLLRKAEVEGLRSQLADLTTDIHEYEGLRDQRIQKKSSRSSR